MMFNEDGLHTTSYSEHNMDEVDSLNSDVVTMPLPANIDSGTNEPPPSIEHDDGYASPEEVRVEGALDSSKLAQSSTDILNAAHRSFVDALKSSAYATQKTIQNVPAETDVGNIRNLERLVCEARVHSAGTTLSLPWEHPNFAGIFGESMDIFPKVLDDNICFENPTSSDVAAVPNPMNSVEILSAKRNFFEDAVSFNAGRTRCLKFDSQLVLMHQRWMHIVQAFANESEAGKMISEELTSEGQLKILGQFLGGKSVATLKKRYGEVARYCRFVNENFFSPAFPVDKTVIRFYVEQLESAGKRSAIQGLVECMNFLKHVLGFNIDCKAVVGGPWLSGVLRGMKNTRPLRKQSRVLKVCELLFLEEFLNDTSRSIIDRYATGCFLFMVYSRARVGDLACIDKYICDVACFNGTQHGYLELHSKSHKMRATGNALGLNLPLIAPLKGVSECTWGVVFMDVAKSAGLDLEQRSGGSPLLPAPSRVGDWTERPISGKEVKFWICNILSQMPFFQVDGFTSHGLKATTLAMLAKYGASEADRLVLGHHSLKSKGSLEVYSRDLQASPLRALDSMLSAIRCGQFKPDLTRSGMVTSEGDKNGVDTTAVFTGELQHLDLPLETPPEATTPVETTLDFPEQSERWDVVEPSSFEHGPVQHTAENDDTSDVDSNSSSDSSSNSSDTDDEVLGSLGISRCQQPLVWKTGCSIFQHKRTKTLHLLPIGSGNSFLCGREKTADYDPFLLMVHSEEWKCRHCDRSRPIRSVDGMCHALDLALKKIKRA